ncbi:MAG: hypothetical protein KJ626_09125 [Verrucomicrobia bacterium]|nr:hypothetical protein [Verrucomicrobiota bacterium]
MTEPASEQLSEYPAPGKESRRIYRGHLGDGCTVSVEKGSVTGFWLPRPETAPDQILEEIENVERNGQCLKETDRIKVLRGTVFGQDALVKRFDLPGMLDRLRYVRRPLRGRRAWAAARTLTDLNIQTPAPLGFLEFRGGESPGRSYFITHFIPDSETLFEWVHTGFRRATHEQRIELGSTLLSDLLSLYRHGIYHADTKTSNVLLAFPDDPERRRLLWIDLECVRCGVRISRRRIIRNLVQINASLLDQVPLSYRRYFAEELAKIYPWVSDERVGARIRRWTGRRLSRNVDHR